MTSFLAFALYLCLSCLLLVAVPVLMHPTLTARRKLLIISASFFILVPFGLFLYALVGVPQMAALR